jgi:alkaline phosphatase D
MSKIELSELRLGLHSRRLFLSHVGRFAVLAAMYPRGIFGRSRWHSAAAPFDLGVASGDPLPGGVVIWTRLTGVANPTAPVPVEWEVAHDERFARIARRGSTLATPELGHSVHVEADGLEPERGYFYRFRTGGEASTVGRTRTAPAANARRAQLRFAFASCQHFEQGYFTAYRHMAAEELDFIVHLGDYIYEGGPASGRPRVHDAPEIITLDDYRRRYALYRSDGDLQAAHAAAPWIVTWDDHEVKNNYADEFEPRGTPAAEFVKRRAVAYQAFYENLPLRRSSMPRGADLHLYRHLQFGDLLSLEMLDGRQYRSRQACGGATGPQCPEAFEAGRTMLGETQERWLADRVRGARTRWNALGNQVMVAHYDSMAGPPERFSMDNWNGYVAARQRLLALLGQPGAGSPIVLTGDIHSNWVCDLKADFSKPDSRVVASEFVCTSISSGSDGSDMTAAGQRALGENPHLRFFNGQRGYVSCTVTPERWRSDYRVVEKVTTPDSPISTRASWVVEHARRGAQRDTT